MGVIKPSVSAGRNPIVLVPKPDGSVPFCIDFQEINKIAEFDAFPMPRTDVLLSLLGEARFISTLDLTKGYWQVPLRLQDKPNTAYATLKGLFQFKVMPFGLNGAAATFQRLVDTVFSTCDDFVLAYLDDILIYSRTWEQHISHLTRVFQLLGDAGLRVNPKKSKLGFTHLKYLGYTIREGSVKPQAKKIAAVQNTPRHSTKKQLCQFSGLAGYYSLFISWFTDIATPLTDRLQKGQPDLISWDETAL